jgi:DNA-binding transcriptional regulator LsrR (DeoR family)
MFSVSFSYRNTDAILTDKNTKEIIIKNSFVKDTYKVFKTLDLALMSTGSYNEDMIKNLFKDSMLPDELTELKEHILLE